MPYVTLRLHKIKRSNYGSWFTLFNTCMALSKTKDYHHILDHSLSHNNLVPSYSAPKAYSGHAPLRADLSGKSSMLCLSISIFSNLIDSTSVPMHLVAVLPFFVISNLSSSRPSSVVKSGLNVQPYELELLVQSSVHVRPVLHASNAVQTVVSYTNGRSPRAARLFPASTCSSQHTHWILCALRCFECERARTRGEGLLWIRVVVATRARVVQDVAAIFIEFFVCASRCDYAVSSGRCVAGYAADFAAMRTFE